MKLRLQQFSPAKTVVGKYLWNILLHVKALTLHFLRQIGQMLLTIIPVYLLGGHEANLIHILLCNKIPSESQVDPSTGDHSEM